MGWDPAPSHISLVMTTTPDFKVQLPVFEGPLDLLLHLIKKRELDITTVSLAAVTDDYLAYLHRLERIDPGRVADFLVIAARLLVIKSRLLLPVEEDTDEEEDGEALARALEAYRQFREIADLLADREAEGLRAYIREAPPPELEPRLDPQDTSLDDLMKALRRVLEERPEEPESVDTVVRPIRVSVRECIENLTSRLRQGTRFNFEELLSGQRSRQEVIGNFLAVLELVKMQRATVQQESLFTPIYIEPIPENIPAPDEEEELVSEFDTPPAEEEA